VNANTGKIHVLYTFTGGPDGGGPWAGLAGDGAGNLYGTTVNGGTATGNAGHGVVFKLDAATHVETVLYTFTGGPDGANPYATLARDSAGNLYGTTYAGGAFGNGTVFELDTAGNLTTLYSFAGGADGAAPNGVILDSSGNIYGTAYSGGADGVGTVFEITP
jgi:uncharacterized repeat protein (TIGR03803 family)